MIKSTLYRLARASARMPRDRAMWLGRCLGWMYGHVIRYHRREALEALQRSLPNEPSDECEGILNRMYLNLGMMAIDSLRFSVGRKEDIEAVAHLAGEDRAGIEEALSGGKGALILSGHIGNWELQAMSAPVFGFPSTIIAKPIKNRAVNAFIVETRARFHVQIVPPQQSYRQCLRVLKRNELVGFMLDQNMTRTEGVFVDFFGRPACTTPGLAYLAAQSQAPVVPIFLLRNPDHRHTFRVLPVIDPPPDRQPDTMREYTQRYTAVLEGVIREHPDQWIWIHRRWRTQPASGSDRA